MEKEKFEEAKKQAEIIKACEQALLDNRCSFLTTDDTIKVVFVDKNVTRSFIRWVANEKEIAEKKFNEI